MHIFVHFPEDSEKKQELAENVALIHAQAVIDYIKAMSCPQEQKIKLIDSIVRIRKTKAGE